ncbi:restriction endonuclease [Janthinobacterium rivuli]|uniref:restriction endonuclease n=1 Tax=Janthinobacterium rivuli TaxID=2751478 RepID=UPI00383B3554
MSKDNNRDQVPPDTARLIQDVIAQLGWPINAELVAEQVRRLDVGLPLEDEFSVICSWLGKCQLLHKLDQQQVPVKSREEFQVPDLLAKFSTQNNKSPVLIEVKSKQDSVLSFRPDYMRRLQNYAELVGMPLLIAWKYHNLWMLFEAKHMTKAVKNFNISLNTASRENLFGTLLGDVAYKIGSGAGVHLRFRKDKLVESTEDHSGREEQWHMTIDDVSFSDYNGEHHKKLDGEVQSLFTTWDLEEEQEHSDTHIHLRFLAGDQGIQFSHTALVRLLNWQEPHKDRPHWRGLLRQDKVAANVENFSSALHTALDQRIVSHIFYFEPHTFPNFLDGHEHKKS